MISPEQQAEIISRVQSVPSGEIFKGIGAVLAAHEERIGTLERKNVSDRWRDITGRLRGRCQHPDDVVCSNCPGKFRKFCSACGAIARWIKIFWIKK